MIAPHILDYSAVISVDRGIVMVASTGNCPTITEDHDGRPRIVLRMVPRVYWTRSFPFVHILSSVNVVWVKRKGRNVECVKCMIDLVNFMLNNRFITDEKEAQRVLDWIRPGLDFEPDAIQKKLNELLANNYWKNLLDEKNQEDGITKKRQKLDNNTRDYPVGKVIEPQMPWDVTEITENGWVLESYDSPALEIMLPPDVSGLGLANMSLSCMKLTYIGLGIWEPSGAFGEDEMVCANVYPP